MLIVAASWDTFFILPRNGTFSVQRGYWTGQKKDYSKLTKIKWKVYLLLNIHLSKRFSSHAAPPSFCSCRGMRQSFDEGLLSTMERHWAWIKGLAIHKLEATCLTSDQVIPPKMLLLSLHSKNRFWYGRFECKVCLRTEQGRRLTCESAVRDTGGAVYRPFGVFDLDRHRHQAFYMPVVRLAGKNGSVMMDDFSEVAIHLTQLTHSLIQFK